MVRLTYTVEAHALDIIQVFDQTLIITATVDSIFCVAWSIGRIVIPRKAICNDLIDRS